MTGRVRVLRSALFVVGMWLMLDATTTAITKRPSEDEPVAEFATGGLVLVALLVTSD